MNARQANQIRRGIYLAHDPLLARYIDYAPRLVRKAYVREIVAADRRIMHAIIASTGTATDREFVRIMAHNGADW